MKPVTVNKYRTPTADNPDCPFSIGVMNLTEAEADIIAQFARGIRSVTGPRALGLTAQDMRERPAERPLTATEAAEVNRRRDLRRELLKADRQRYEAVRAEALKAQVQNPEIAKQWLTGDWGEATREPELSEPNSRFAGLDIPDEPNDP